MKKFLLAAFAMVAFGVYASNIASEAVSAQDIKEATPEMMKKMIDKTAQSLRVKHNVTRPVTVASDLEGMYSWSYQMASKRCVDPDTATISSTGTKTVSITAIDDQTVKLCGFFDAGVTGTLDLETYSVPVIKLNTNEISARVTLTVSGSSVVCKCSVRALFYYVDEEDESNTGWYFSSPVIFVLDNAIVFASDQWLTRYVVSSTNNLRNGYTINPVWMPSSLLTEQETDKKIALMSYNYNDFDWEYLLPYSETVNRGTNSVTFDNFANVAVNPISFTLYEDKTWDAEPQVLYSNTNGTYTLYAYPSPGAANLAGTGDETTLVSSTNWTGYDLETRYWIGNRNPFTIKGEFTWPTTTAVENINAKTVSAVKYVNIAGQVSNTAFDGMNIVITDYTDGTSNVSKVVK